ncbi:unnamed protein product [Heterobilharzia americana]|nr:unnamed protein product [Heterobilharzia americana]
MNRRGILEIQLAECIEPIMKRKENNPANLTTEVENARRLGILNGAKLASEFGFSYGMALEIISPRHSSHCNSSIISSDVNITNEHRIQSRRDIQIYKTASDLHQYLVGSNGLIDISNCPQLNKTIECTFNDNDELLKLIRNKAKQLKSLLDIHSVEQEMNNLTF